MKGSPLARGLTEGDSPLGSLGPVPAALGSDELQYVAADACKNAKRRKGLATGDSTYAVQEKFEKTDTSTIAG